MDLVLGIVAVLGLGAFVIAFFVFAAAARRYVTGDDVPDGSLSPDQHLIAKKSKKHGSWPARSEFDRRKAPTPARFPLVVAGEVIERDRRSGRDRRAMA